MKVLVRPVAGPQREIDITHRLVAAIAEELWRLYGGNEQLNWLEAELHLRRIVGEVRTQREAAGVVIGGEPIPVSGPDRGAAARRQPRRELTARARSRRRPARPSDVRVTTHP